MKQSRRALRMQRHHARKKDRNASLNMVSLMDIFTILVFFLLVNAGSEEVLPSPKNITLPQSIAEKMPKISLVIAVNNDTITLQGKNISSVNDVTQSKDSTIKPLFNALKTLSASAEQNPEAVKSITIMADKEIPYALLKKIMLTCVGADYNNLSFAVSQKAAKVDS